MNRRRLEHTAREVLPFVEPDNFYMGNWKCGTTACAFGHECLSPFGKRNGLQLLSDGREQEYRMPLFKGVLNFKAVAAYYEIDAEAAGWIFGPNDYDESDPSPASVAERIESLLASEP